MVCSRRDTWLSLGGRASKHEPIIETPSIPRRNCVRDWRDRLIGLHSRCVMAGERVRYHTHTSSSKPVVELCLPRHTNVLFDHELQVGRPLWPGDFTLSQARWQVFGCLLCFPTHLIKVHVIAPILHRPGSLELVSLFDH